MVERDLAKVETRVRFSSPAPFKGSGFPESFFVSKGPRKAWVSYENDLGLKALFFSHAIAYTKVRGTSMKKLSVSILFLCCLLASVWAQAASVEEVEERVEVRAFQAQREYSVMVLVSAGNVAALRSALPYIAKEALLQRDGHGNNVLHLAKKKEMFTFLWNLLGPEKREYLLAQRNNIGEVPLMSQIMYGQEEIFLQYFPKTRLYEQFKMITADLNKNGLARQIAETKRDELMRQTSVGSHTLWSRAHVFYQGAVADTHLRMHRASMLKIQRQIEQVAPFLVTVFMLDKGGL